MRAKKILLGMGILGLSTATFGVSAVAADYYSSISNTTSGTTLASDLHALLSSTHTRTLSYGDLWDLYYDSDVLPGTKIIWDIYSEFIFTAGTDQAGTYSNEGDKYNREHTVPQSWFDKDSPMVADGFHIYPTDGKINGIRSSNPYGEVGTVSYSAPHGGKQGSSKIPSYSGTVFEPMDEYKGDIARSYMYMAIRYSDKLGNWTAGESQKIFTSSYPYLTSYAKDLFTKWSHEDPVSDKEYIRNEAIYEWQHDRNPFIDHPEYIDVIWTNNYSDQASNTIYNVQDVTTAISSLTSSSDDKTVYLTYEKYCRLNTTDKALVTNASQLFSIVEAKANTGTDLDTYWETIINRGGTLTVDQAKVDNVVALINALPETITLDNEIVVNNAKNAYQALNSLEKAEVTNYAKLESAINTIAVLKNQTQIQNVISLINALPDTITEDDIDAVNNAEGAYNSLPIAARAKVTNHSKLEDAIAQANALQFKTYDLVTDDTKLAVGDEIIIAAADYDKALAGVQSDYYRAGVSIVKEDDSITLANEENTINRLTLVAGNTSGTFGLYNGSEYLASSPDHNNLLGVNTLTDYASWTISITSEGKAVITSSGSTTSGSSTYHCSMYWDTKYSDFTSNQNIPSTGYVQVYKLHTDNGGGDVPPVVHYAHEDFAKLSTKSSLKFNYVSETTQATGDGTYHLVTNESELSVGDTIIIVGQSNGSNYALSTTQNNNNRGQVAITITDNVISTVPSGVQLLTLEQGSSEGTFGLSTGSGYLYAAGSGKNYLRTQPEIDKNASFAFKSNSETMEIKAKDSSNRNLLKYNSSAECFSCYSSGQIECRVYKLAGTTEKTTYTYSNVYLRYGTGLSKELYDALLEEGNEVSFGVAVSVDGTNYTQYTFNPVRVAEIGAKTEAADGEFYQFFAIMPIASDKFTTVVSAKCFVTIDGVTYYSKSASYSVSTLVKYYISNSSSLGLTEAELAVLGGF